MAKEQVDTDGYARFLALFAKCLAITCLAFCMEKALAVFLIYDLERALDELFGYAVVCSRIMSSPAVGFLIHSNSLYLILVLFLLLLLNKVTNNRNLKNPMDLAGLLVIATAPVGTSAFIEILRFGGPILDTLSVVVIGAAAIVTAVLVDLVANERIKNKVDKENTGHEEVVLERRSSCSNAEFQSLEAKYHAKYENLLQKYIDHCQRLEEERSQLMKELGAARAYSPWFAF